ncbi:MAG: 6-carboxytetrahydropterin synthase [Planctomycetota bacterium]
MPVVEITHREEFAASHRLHNPALSDEENRRIFGICNNLHGHGHSYELEVSVRGPVPGRTGMVMNLLELGRILRERVIADLDHKNLDLDVPWLAGRITTAENLAIAIWERLEPVLGAHEGCRMHRIRLYESTKNRVEYCGPAS